MLVARDRACERYKIEEKHARVQGKLQNGHVKMRNAAKSMNSADGESFSLRFFFTLCILKRILR